jgi:hypothetical protein
MRQHAIADEQLVSYASLCRREGGTYDEGSAHVVLQRSDRARGTEGVGQRSDVVQGRGRVQRAATLDTYQYPYQDSDRARTLTFFLISLRTRVLSRPMADMNFLTTPVSRRNGRPSMLSFRIASWKWSATIDTPRDIKLTKMAVARIGDLPR